VIGYLRKQALSGTGCFWWVFGCWTLRLLDENMENALANFTFVKMPLFPFLQFEPSGRQIEQTAIPNMK
jgi:hypothetical protein